MKILNLVQGSQEWLDARILLRTASEAPAMMGDSKYINRVQLLDHKKGWTTIVNEYTLKLFKDGHEAEERARPIAEQILGEDLSPICGALEDSLYMSSYDGITMFRDIVWEHKLWNKTLAENVMNEVLEPHYYWQLEHQLLVSGAERAMFMVSDGTEQNMVHMFYESIPERRHALIAGWKQFDIDFETHELEAKTEKTPPQQIVQLPEITYEVNGLSIVSNIDEYKNIALKLVKIAKKKPASDQEYSNAIQLVKDFKTAEKRLEEVRGSIKSQFVDIEKITNDILFIERQFQAARIAADKYIKERKDEIKNAIIQPAQEEICFLIDEASVEYGVKIDIPYDFKQAAKNKRNIDSLKAAVNEELARAKVALTEKIEEIKLSTPASQPCTQSRVDTARCIVESIQSTPTPVTKLKQKAEETVTITTSEYQYLIQRNELLEALEASGVNCWDGWDNALDMLKAS